NTPEIVAAFESALGDGMNLINYSGGGPETDPVNDAMIETVRNVAAAGVVPVIAAGNDRDDFGLGSTGSPGTAPAGIAVAAVTNSHIFTPALSVSDPGAPASVQQIPIENQRSTPASWAFSDNPLVDVSSIVVNGQPSDPYLCGPVQNPNAPVATLPAHSLDGAIALVLRGRCAGRADPLLHAPRVRRLAVRRLRWDEHGHAARGGRGGAARPAASRVVGAAGEVGARLDRRPGVGGHPDDEGGAGRGGGRRP